MDIYNPDYPVSGGSFTQHTYDGNPYEQSFYYNGNCAVNPFANNTAHYYGGAPADSRRNWVQTPPQQPQQPFNGYNASVNPFANNQIPSNNGAPQLNSLIESRRNTGVPQNNPIPQNTFGIQPVGTAPSFVPNNGYGCNDSTSALYSNPNFGFDRKGGNVWDNIYTTPQTPIAPATIDWSNQQQNLNPVGQYQMVQFQTPEVTRSWSDIAKDIWK